MTVGDDGVAENDTFYGTLASVVLDSPPSLGTISNWDGLGGFTYVPDYHAYGEDSFTYHDVDQYGQTSNEATVTIDVSETAPVAADVNYNVLHDQEISVPPNGVLSSSSDSDPPDMGHLSAVLFNEPSQGTLSDYVDGGGTDHPHLVDGSFAYTPPSKWAGTVTFQFKVSDGILSSAPPATATIDVTDQALVASDPGPYYVGAVDAGQTPNTLTVDAPGVLQNASDADGENSADAVYVQIAIAHWYFNGSGTLTGAQVGDCGTWAGIMNVTGNGGDSAFTTVTTGSRVPVTTGTTFNKTAFTWTTPPFSQ